jgi:hypothetical protein
METNYESNSHASKRKKEAGEDRKVEKVISGTAKTKKKSEIRKFTDIFVSEDVGNVKNYIFMDVLIPAVKKAISDIVTNGIDMLLYGESGRTKKNSTASKISYRSFYERPGDRDRRDTNFSRSRNGLDYDNIIFETRGDAQAVLSAMEDAIDEFKFVSIGDLYDLADISTHNHAINNYGWTNLSTASVQRVRDGYMLKLPRALPLE